VHDHRVRVRDVQAGLDDHGRHQNVLLAVHEIAHHAVQLPLLHLAVRDRDACPRREPADPLRHRRDGFDPIVHEEHLPTAIQLAREHFLEELVVPRLDEGEHR
jgi:hypothetical protein